MSLGKTIQAVAAAFFMFRAFEIRTLIVAPKSLTEQWRGEAVRWFADAFWMKVATYDMAGTCCPNTYIVPKKDRTQQGFIEGLDGLEGLLVSLND